MSSRVINIDCARAIMSRSTRMQRRRKTNRERRRMLLYFQQQLRNVPARPRKKMGRQFPETLWMRSRIRRCLGLGQMITPPSSTTSTTTYVARGANGRAWSTSLWPSLGRTRGSMLGGMYSDSEKLVPRRAPSAVSRSVSLQGVGVLKTVLGFPPYPVRGRG
jgi:hypothetical protein